MRMIDLRLRAGVAVLVLAALLSALGGGQHTAVPAAAPAVLENGRQVTVPVLMYHSVLKSKSKQGRYTIGPDALEADLKYLQAQGYTSVVTQDLVRFVEEGAPLPEKPVLLTFDDGHYNNVAYAEPLLERYGMRAVIFVVGAFSEQSAREEQQNPNYSYVDWNTLRGMAERGVWDIQSHTWDMHSSCGKRYGIRRIKGESEAAYAAALRADTEAITARLAELTGTAPTAFAYPFGCRTAAGDAVLQACGYKITFGCEDKPAVFTVGRPACLLDVHRLLRSCDRPVSTLLR